MKKSLLGIFLFIPVLWGIMTWVASNKTESVFNEMLAQSQQKINETVPVLTIEKLSFSKGFISSTAQSVIRINPELFDYDEPFKITLNHVIYHGPLMLTSDGIKIGTSYIKTSLDQDSLEEKTQAAIALIFAGKQPFLSNTLTSFSNSITEYIDIPVLHFDANALELEHDDQSNLDLNLSGVSAELTTNPEATYLEGFIATGALNITGVNDSKRFSFNASKSDILFDIDELYHGVILIGSMTFELPEILVNNSQQDISLKNIRIKSSGSEQEEGYSQSASFDIDKLLINTNAATNILPESNFHMGFELKGLEKSATRDLIDISQSLSETQASLLGNASAQAQQQLDIDINQYLQAVSELINPGLTSNILIELSNNQGMSNIHFDLSYVATQKLLELKTMKDLIIALSAELRVNIDKNMVAGTPLEPILSSSMANNPLIDNGQAYTANMTLEGGQLVLNGNPIPLLDMLGSAANKPLNLEQYFQ